LREHADVRICSLVESHAAELYRRHGLDRDVMHEVVIALMAMIDGGGDRSAKDVTSAGFNDGITHSGARRDV
jgi:hypothetical protein